MKSKAKYSFVYKNLFKLYLLGSLRRFSVPLLLIPIYLFVGPWYIGHLLNDHIGAGFVWGLMVNWTILPTALTYIWGLIIVSAFALNPTELNTVEHCLKHYFFNFVSDSDSAVPPADHVDTSAHRLLQLHAPGMRSNAGHELPEVRPSQEHLLPLRGPLQCKCLLLSVRSSIAKKAEFD